MASSIRLSGGNIDLLVAQVRSLEARIANGEAVDDDVLPADEKRSGALKVAKLAKTVKMMADQARLTKISQMAESIFYEACEKIGEKKPEL